MKQGVRSAVLLQREKRRGPIVRGSKRVYVLDDEPAVRRSLEFLLRSSGYHVRSFASGPEFLAIAARLPAGCLLLDLQMPAMDGLEVQRGIKQGAIGMPVVVLTGHADVAIAVEAMKAGAIDLLEKPVAKDALFTALSAAFDRLDDAREAATTMRTTAQQIALLTARERQVLRGLAEGMGNKAIARDLGISPRTVEVHRANVKGKLGARSLSDVLRLAFSAGLAA